MLPKDIFLKIEENQGFGALDFFRKFVVDLWIKVLYHIYKKVKYTTKVNRYPVRDHSRIGY